MENPTYRQAYRVFKGLGHEVVPVSMDEYGMKVEELAKSDALISYVMPSHQFPLGVVMPIKRRLELLAWADEGRRYIIEDDYDSEFRYRGKPIPSLQGVDRKDCVIYIGTFSKSVAPAIRLSYMVLPNSLLERCEQFNFYSSTVSRIDQNIMDSFIREGYFERHLNRMRAVYKAKHDVLMGELKELKGFTISGENAGLHVLLTEKGGRSEEELIRLARSFEVRVYGLSDYYITENTKQQKTVVLGYANMTEQEIREGIRRLKEAWK
ncbi:MAG: PLP-dependent aminotransferase family protein, partial [Lachnospiraceae bacterium]|nr:PLP-dependent aminotransferase family protein [Lachnospiraceae bacterium]